MREEDNKLVIAIDGPAASGKSTVAQALARRLGVAIIDSGSMYRAVTLIAVEEGVGLDDERGLLRPARVVRRDFRLELPMAGPQRVFLGSREVTEEIRSAAVGRAVSPVSTVAGVRDEMVSLQRETVPATGAVVEGRDIGSTVFPDATLKVFLDATRSERVDRRYRELMEKEVETTRYQVEEEIQTRDSIDSQRELSPLREPPGAVRIDTTGRSIDQVVEVVISELEGGR